MFPRLRGARYALYASAYKTCACTAHLTCNNVRNNNPKQRIVTVTLGIRRGKILRNVSNRAIFVSLSKISVKKLVGKFGRYLEESSIFSFRDFTEFLVPRNVSTNNRRIFTFYYEILLKNYGIIILSYFLFLKNFDETLQLLILIRMFVKYCKISFKHYSILAFSPF